MQFRSIYWRYLTLPPYFKNSYRVHERKKKYSCVPIIIYLQKYSVRNDISKKNVRVINSKGFYHTEKHQEPYRKYSRLQQPMNLLNNYKYNLKMIEKSLWQFYYSMPHPHPWFSNSLHSECGILTLGYWGSKTSIILQVLWFSIISYPELPEE